MEWLCNVFIVCSTHGGVVSVNIKHTKEKYVIIPLAFHPQCSSSPVPVFRFFRDCAYINLIV